MSIKRRAHPPNPKIATRIRAALEASEMSQNDLASVLGFSAASVSLFINGHTQPRDDTVRRIAEILGEDFNFLMGYADSGAKGLGKTVDRILTKATPDELALLEDLDEDDFHKLMGQAALKQAARKKRRKRRGAVAACCLAALVGLGATISISGHHRDHHGVAWTHCDDPCECPICGLVRRLPHDHPAHFPPHHHA